MITAIIFGILLFIGFFVLLGIVIGFVAAIIDLWRTHQRTRRDRQRRA